jgi:hypothetical protein
MANGRRFSPLKCMQTGAKRWRIIFNVRSNIFQAYQCTSGTCSRRTCLGKVEICVNCAIGLATDSKQERG